MDPWPVVKWANSLLVRIGVDDLPCMTAPDALEQFVRDCVYALIITNSSNHCKLGFHQVLRAIYNSEDRDRMANSLHEEYMEFIRSIVADLPPTENPSQEGVEDVLVQIRELSPPQTMLEKFASEVSPWAGPVNLACFQDPVGKGEGKRASDAPDGPAEAKKIKTEDMDTSDDNLIVKSRKSTPKQSDIFSSPVPLWHCNKDGDPEQPKTWYYVAEWSQDGVYQLPKYVILSNIVAWKVWSSNIYTPSELAKYWPLDFAVKDNQAVLASGRRPRGMSQIFNCDWAELPVWKHGSVVMTRVHSNHCWGSPRYCHDDPVPVKTVWPDASSIAKISFDHKLVRLYRNSPDEQAITVSVTTTLPKLDNDTLFVTVASKLVQPNPELPACFPNNHRFLHEIEQPGMQTLDESSAFFCGEIGSDFGAPDVLILPWDPHLDSSALFLRRRLAKYLPIAFGVGIYRRKRKVVFGGLFDGEFWEDKWPDEVLVHVPVQEDIPTPQAVVYVHEMDFLD